MPTDQDRDQNSGQQAGQGSAPNQGVSAEEPAEGANDAPKPEQGSPDER